MYSSEQIELRDLAHDFAAAELRPRTAEWDGACALDEGVFTQLAELGFLGMRIPEQHGGLGFDLPTYQLVLEELAWGDAAVALSVAIHNGPVTHLLVRHGSDEQKDLWLPRLASGEVLGAFAFSEPDAGSDPESIATRAERSGEDRVLHGAKRWVTNGARAGLVATFARTGEEGLGVFLVTPDDDGYEVGAREKTMGLRASETVSVRLDGVRVGRDRVVGEVGGGVRYALEALDVARVGSAAQAVGIGRAAMEHASEYALGREQFGGPISRFGAIQAKLADMAYRLEAGRAVAHLAAVELQGWLDGERESRTGVGGATARAAIAKLVASEAATWIADEAVQVHGGYGYMRHYPVEKLLRDAKGAEIYEGTNEIMRAVIAREILRDVGDATHTAR